MKPPGETGPTKRGAIVEALKVSISPGFGFEITDLPTATEATEPERWFAAA